MQLAVGSETQGLQGLGTTAPAPEFRGRVPNPASRAGQPKSGRQGQTENQNSPHYQRRDADTPNPALQYRVRPQFHLECA